MLTTPTPRGLLADGAGGAATHADAPQSLRFADSEYTLGGMQKSRALRAAALAVVALVLTACGSSSGATRVDANAFATTVADPAVVVLDVRTPAEFATGHLANAINIDAQSGSFDAQIAALDPTKTYAVYCRSGNRSQGAVSKMSDAGITNIVELESGIVGWQAAGLPIING